MAFRNVATVDPSANLARNLRTRRSAMGLSQRALAESAGISRETVIRVERGEGTTLRNLQALAKALGTTAAKLLAPPPKARQASRRVRDAA